VNSDCVNSIERFSSALPELVEQLLGVRGLAALARGGLARFRPRRRTGGATPLTVIQLTKGPDSSAWTKRRLAGALHRVESRYCWEANTPNKDAVSRAQKTYQMVKFHDRKGTPN